MFESPAVKEDALPLSHGGGDEPGDCFERERQRQTDRLTD